MGDTALMLNPTLSRVVWKVSLPIIFVEATETADHLIDTLFLARVGVTELGAIAVADSVLLLALILPLALVDSIQILSARRLGQLRPEAAGAAFQQGLVLVLLCGALCTAALKLLSPLIAAGLVESPAVAGAVDSYLQIDAYSVLPAGVAFACSALLTSLGRTRALIPATGILIVTDVALNYLFIFGSHGFPALGMRGAAVGSVGAESCTALYLLLHLWRDRSLQPIGPFRLRRFDRRIFLLLGRLAAPIASIGLLENFRWLVYFLIIEHVGTSALAIANIVYTCYIVFWIPTAGFSETACSLVSRFVGRQRGDRIGEVLRSATGGAILATIPFIAIALSAPQWLVAAFSTESDLLGESSASLRVVAAAMLVAIPGQMWFTAVIGTGDTAAAVAIELLLTLVMLGVAYLTAIRFAGSMALIWLAVPIAWLVCLTVSYGWMKSGIWKRLEI